jgi:hypothetical protein
LNHFGSDEPVVAPHERLVLRLDAVLQLFAPHPVQLAVVLVDALVPPDARADERVLLLSVLDVYSYVGLSKARCERRLRRDRLRW